MQCTFILYSVHEMKVHLSFHRNSDREREGAIAPWQFILNKTINAHWCFSITACWQADYIRNLRMCSSSVTSWIKQSFQICAYNKRTTLLSHSQLISKFILYRCTQGMINFWSTDINCHLQFHYFKKQWSICNHVLMVKSRQLVSAIIYFLIEYSMFSFCDRYFWWLLCQCEDPVTS